MFVLRWTEGAATAYARLKAKADTVLVARRHRARTKSSRDEGLFKQLHKCVSLLAENPRHPGLRTHEYHSLPHPFNPKDKVFEAYVQNHASGAYRVFWCYGPAAGEITVIAITPHP